MSDVAMGGDTVFVQLGIGVRPRKGSAIVWFNLHKSGELDSRLMHAGCPILVGSKWGRLEEIQILRTLLCHRFIAVCTKWLREHGQEFLRPCGLTKD
jgi:prolyl 4-hydroxylase